MTIKNNLKIGIIGTGAIAGYYGLMLQRSGLAIRFLARSGHEQLQRDGMSIHSESLGTLQHAVEVCRDIEQLSDCDWILVTTKTTANAEIAKLLSRLTNSTAKVVLLQNGFANEDELRAQLPANLPLFAGLCYVFARRTEPGVIQHQGGGIINIGYHSGLSAEDGMATAQQLIELFNNAGVKSQYIDVHKARWQKLVWNLPYNGLSVVLNARTKAMMNNPACYSLLADLMQEVVDIASAAGHQLADNIVQTTLNNTMQMADYYPSMHGDYTEGNQLELQAIYRAPLAAAEKLGLSMPKTQMLLQQLEFIQARRDA